jgi:4-deoxy-L-threo-5-hexosulose-uronate ketol-isomerase
MTDVRHATHPEELDGLSPEELRNRFVVEGMFSPGEVRWMLSHHDRILIGGAVTGGRPVILEPPPEVRAENLCDRRELGIACLEGNGQVQADGEKLDVHAEDIVYVGQGTQEVALSGDAVFYLVSTPAHRSLPTTLACREDVETLAIGDQANASRRTLRKYIHADGVQSCELAMGITTIEPGNVWNTMPCHTHDRRTEVYFYFDLPEDARVIHLCGRPDRTRSMVLANRQAVISPPWSIHTGAGTAPYKFVWSTAGENLAYNDMDLVDTRDLR